LLSDIVSGSAGNDLEMRGCLGRS